MLRQQCRVRHRTPVGGVHVQFAGRTGGTERSSLGTHPACWVAEWVPGSPSKPLGPRDCETGEERQGGGGGDRTPQK